MGFFDKIKSGLVKTRDALITNSLSESVVSSAGGGFIGGKVVGSTDSNGEKVATRPVSPCDLIGTVYMLMGIDPYGKLPHVSEGELPILPSLLDSKKSHGLLYEIIDIKEPKYEK